LKAQSPLTKPSSLAVLQQLWRAGIASGALNAEDIKRRERERLAVLRRCSCD